MKNLLYILTLSLISLIVSSSIVNAMNYEEASKSSSPMALLVYADWADDINNVHSQFYNYEEQYKGKINFAELNIASEETKEYNKKNNIYANLPYVMFYKNNAKMSHYVSKDCILDKSCFANKVELFLH